VDTAKRYISLTGLAQTKQVIAANVVDGTATDSREIAT